MKRSFGAWCDRAAVGPAVNATGHQRTCAVLSDAGTAVCALASVLCLLPRVAQAQPGFYEIFESRYHVQSGPDQPTDVVSHFGYLRITGVDLPSFFDSATVAAPTGEVFTLESPADGGVAIAFVSGVDQNEIDSRLPGGTYTFATVGGPLDGQSGELIHPEFNYFPEVIPYIVNWFELSGGIDPSVAFTLEVPTWSGEPGLSETTTFVGVRRVVDNVGVFSTFFPSSQGSVLVDADTLEPNTEYVVNIAFSARFYAATSTWGGAAAGSAYDLVTDIAFTTGDSNPGCSDCPADFNCDGGVDGSDIGAFFEAWEAGDSTSDLNSDGGVDGADVATFFAHWEAGC